MARKVFYSFCYDDDIFRANIVRNQWVTKGGQIESGIIDAAEFEKIKKTGDEAVKKWIDQELEETTVTVVLLGENTLSRPFVRYEICQSYNRNNGIIGVYVNNLKDFRNRSISSKYNPHTIIGSSKGTSYYFDDIYDGIFDYIRDDGYNNLSDWVEFAARKHNH